jgi:CelD/BcsL family acetyltransferase involved in cellulose biosynthesis
MRGVETSAVASGPQAREGGPARIRAGARALTVETLETTRELERLAPEWRRLADGHADGLPFRSWEWQSAWWRHFSEQRLLLRDALWVHAVRDDAGALVAVAPKMITTRPALGRLGGRSAWPTSSARTPT